MNVSPALGSVADRAPTCSPSEAFSRMDWLSRAMSVGGSLASVIVIVNVSSYISPPESIARMTTSALGSDSWSSHLPYRTIKSVPSTVNRSEIDSPSSSCTTNVSVSPVFGSVPESVPMIVPSGECSGTVLLDKAMSVGASLKSLTVIVKARSPQDPPESVDRTMMSWLVAAS